MADIVARLRRFAPEWTSLTGATILYELLNEAADEIERLQELLRGTGANRYWEGRWRDLEAEIDRLRRSCGESG